MIDFTIDDEVFVAPGTAGAADLQGSRGRVVAVEPGSRFSVVVRFPGHPSGRGDCGWLFDPATLTRATLERQAV
ncbi:hypothetical protein [Curtobacterium sp. MCBD17_040]|uniref:hypothetical protein n=1 Tax=Curtobacterium sp. MCBD17_040 TaxID=2175674 RepID=UPI000DA84DFA|nr:hypothetical protein [Curtobacterium sp. MCBD17_040]WIB65483.1 hypothetical protein DEI94_19105 [Curtobacterium sp. MCBD17_040]